MTTPTVQPGEVDQNEVHIENLEEVFTVEEATERILPMLAEVNRNGELEIRDLIYQKTQEVFAQMPEVLAARPRYFSLTVMGYSFSDREKAAYRKNFINARVHLDEYMKVIMQLLDDPAQVQKYVQLLNPAAKALFDNNFGKNSPTDTKWLEAIFLGSDHQNINWKTAHPEKVAKYINEVVFPTLFERDSRGDYPFKERRLDQRGKNAGIIAHPVYEDSDETMLVVKDSLMSACHKSNWELVKNLLNDMVQIICLIAECEDVEEVSLNLGNASNLIPTYRKPSKQ